MNDLDGRRLPDLARQTLRGALGLEIYQSPVAEPSPSLLAPGACFVTLTQGGNLRGCMGTLAAWRPLWEDVKNNTLAAAFRDPRFPPLSPEEEPSTDLEVSVLTPPAEVNCPPGEGILDYLKPGIHGVILTCRGRRSTFLPQVWEQLPDKVHFLEHLSQKAGLDAGAWRSSEARFQLYLVEKWTEVPGRNQDLLSEQS